MRYFLIVAALAAFLLVAGGEYLPVGNSSTLTVLTDDGGDSTRTSGTVDLGPTYGYKTLIGKFTLGAPLLGLHTGGLDTGWLWLYRDFASDRQLVDSTFAEGLPITLTTRILEAVGDTGLAGGLSLDWEIYDSCGDTAYNELYLLKWNYLLK